MSSFALPDMYVGTLIPLLGVQYLGSAQVLRKGLDKQWRRSWLVLDSIKKSLVFLDSVRTLPLLKVYADWLTR